MKNFLILGATSTVAMSLAKICAAQGHRVQLAARNSSRLLPFKKDLEIRFDTEVDVLEFDVENYESHSFFYSQIGHKPDIAVCLFGFLGDTDLAEQSWAHAKQILEVNFVGAVSILNIIGQDFRKRGVGTIVGVSSVAGDRGRQSNYIYGSAKAAFTTYLSGLRNRLFRHGVNVITIKPGFIDTKMTAGIKTIKILTASSDKVAMSILNSIQRKRDVVYVLWIWKWILFMICLIPEKVFKRLNL